MALKRGLQSGALKQAKGTGAAGSFRLGESKASSGHVRKTRKPRAKKTSTGRKSTGVKKPQVKRARKVPVICFYYKSRMCQC
ncbi:unnamed protein product [Gongylonema pulchrum]|uniref:H15 domain-containing protein n=1 Tax=Gongylonema pulchrum TaxID=637853 RepID=A0A183EAR5_9BILA|nr:unnamed protein product [Gongylonema pulchrum]